MTPERKAKLTRRFEGGKLKKVIATPVWNVGVDFRHLEVLIRADAGGSPVNDIQIPGRNSRHKRSEDVKGGARKKLVGIVHDYMDHFDHGFLQKSKSRERSYTRMEWEQHHVSAGRKTKLNRIMQFGSIE